MGLAKWNHNPFVPVVPPHQPFYNVFGVGLALGLWLYSGYEQSSSVAEEVENPRRTYPFALAIVVPLSIAVYFLPTLASLAALGNWQQWHTRYFSDAAQLIGGPWLGSWMTIAAMVTNLSLLNATVLTSTRMPFAMAEDGYLPPALTGKHPRFATPWIAIIASGVIYAVLAMHSLTATHHDLQLAAGRHHDPHRAGRLAIAPQDARTAAFVCRAGRIGWIDQCGAGSDRDERGGPAFQRPLRDALGPGRVGCGATFIFDLAPLGLAG